MQSVSARPLQCNITLKQEEISFGLIKDDLLYLFYIVHLGFSEAMTSHIFVVHRVKTAVILHIVSGLFTVVECSLKDVDKTVLPQYNT